MTEREETIMRDNVAAHGRDAWRGLGGGRWRKTTDAKLGLPFPLADTARGLVVS
jgi:hypothetical protein